MNDTATQSESKTTAEPLIAPIVDAPIVVAIPDELKILNQWNFWGFEFRDGKPTKVPYGAGSNNPPHKVKSSANNPKSWLAFPVVVSWYKRHGTAGIGFQFADDGPHFGIDLDDCRNPETGEIEPKALQIIRQFDSYTEISPSKTGVKIIARGRLNLADPDQPGKLKSGRRGPIEWSEGHVGAIEVYDRRRFFAITGDVLVDGENRCGGDATPIPNRESELLESFPIWFPPADDDVPDDHKTDVPPNGFAGDDATVIEKGRSFRNGQKFNSLLAGDWKSCGYLSQSEADSAMCGMFAFLVGPNESRIDGLFRQTGLYREKWEREDYRNKTISLALKSRTQFYDWERQKKNGNGKLTAADLLERGIDIDDALTTGTNYCRNTDTGEIEEYKSQRPGDQRETFTDCDGKEHTCGPDGWPAPTSVMQVIGGSLQIEAEPWDAGWFTVDELEVADLTEEYHLPGLIPCSQPIVFGGPDKGTKTTQTLEMLGCISTGDIFGLDSGISSYTFRPQIPGRCAFVTCESGAAAIRKTMRRMARARGFDSLTAVYPDLFLRTMKYDLCAPPVLAMLARLIVAKKIRVIAFDPAYLMMSGIGDDASNIFKMGGYLEPLTRLARDYGCALILLHHFTKGAILNSVGKKPELSWLSMAGFGSWARAWILIARRQAYDHQQKGVHKLHMITGGPSYSHDWAVDVDEGLEGGQFKIEFRDGEAVAESAAEEKSDKRAERAHAAKEKTAVRNAGNLLLLLEKTNVPITMNTARSGTGVKLDAVDVSTAMARLVVAQEVKVIKLKGGNGKMVEGWALPSYVAPAEPAEPAELQTSSSAGSAGVELALPDSGTSGTAPLGGVGEVPLCPPARKSGAKSKPKRRKRRPKMQGKAGK